MTGIEERCWPVAQQRVLQAAVLLLVVLSAGLHFGRGTGNTLFLAECDDSSLEMRLDLNLATAAELEALPGIGPSLALRIEEFRGRRGSFLRAVDLLDVPGIGQKKLAKIRSYIQVRGDFPR